MIAVRVITHAAAEAERIAKADAMLAELADVTKATAVQTLIFDRATFDREQVIAWVEAHDFTHDKPLDETADSWRVRQREPGEFVEGSLRTINLTTGVQAVIGRLAVGIEATAIEKARARRSKSYLEAVLEMARKQLPDWLWRQVHAAAFPSSGGRARAATRLTLEGKASSVAKSLTPLVCLDDEKRLIYAVAMEPDVEDAHGEATTLEEVEAAAHAFMLGERGVNVDHKGANVPAEIVENWVQQGDATIGGEKVRSGSWVVAIHVTDDALWARAKAGEFGGVSVEGMAQRSA